MANKKRVELEFIKGYGDNFKAIREKKGLTLVELGKIINYSDKTISLIETEQRTPTIEQLNVYRSKFNVSLDYLTGHTTVSDVSLSQICEYTGLSKEAITFLHNFEDTFMIDKLIISAEFKEIVNQFCYAIIFRDLLKPNNNIKDDFNDLLHKDNPAPAFVMLATKNGLAPFYKQQINELINKLFDRIISEYDNSEEKKIKLTPQNS